MYTVYNLFSASVYWQDMSQSCRASTPSWKKPSRNSVDLANPCGAGAHTGWMLIFFNFFSIVIILQRSPATKHFLTTTITEAGSSH